MPQMPDRNFIDWLEDAPQSVANELENRFEELSGLQQAQVQLGTSIPQLYGSLSKFVANPSTVSVETYKRMLDTDETLGSGIDFMNLAMIARFGDYTHPLPQVQAFVRKALNQMEGSWHGNLDEMFSAEWSGFSTTEKVWKFVEDFDGAPAFLPKKLVTYNPLTIVFAVDRHGEVLKDGIYQYQRYHNTFFNQFGYGIRRGEINGFRPDLYASIGDYPYPVRIAADLSYLTVKIPKDKIIHLRSSSTGKFDNPYGRSILRRIYKNWVMKDAFLKMWLIAADRKGTPLVVGYAAPNDTVQSDVQTTQGSNVQGNRADAAMANVFKTIHNSSFIVLPGKKGETYDIEAIQVQGDMNVFKDAVDYFNKAIMRGLLIPPLVMSGGDGGGSYALGSEHHKVFRQCVDGKLKPYKQAILDGFIKEIISYNFPEKLWSQHGLGDFVVEEFDPEIMEKLANIYSTLSDKGYMSESDQADFDAVRQKMNLPKRKAPEPMGSLIDPLDEAEGAIIGNDGGVKDSSDVDDI